LKPKEILDVVGTIGVLVGLGFVGLQIRQNTNAVRAAALQSIAEMSLEAALAVAQDDDLSEAYGLAMRQGPTVSHLTRL
jgi:hypothetical protein